MKHLPTKCRKSCGGRKIPYLTVEEAQGRVQELRDNPKVHRSSAIIEYPCEFCLVLVDGEWKAPYHVGHLPVTK